MQSEFNLEHCRLALEPDYGDTMFEGSELLTFYVLDDEECMGEVYLIDARALPEKLYVETCADGLVSLNTELVARQHAELYERYAAISITNENPMFRISGVI